MYYISNLDFYIYNIIITHDIRKNGNRFKYDNMTHFRGF